MNKSVICWECPLLVENPDEGMQCNLGYTTYFKGWDNLYSDECKLILVQFEDQEFKPKSQGDN